MVKICEQLEEASPRAAGSASNAGSKSKKGGGLTLGAGGGLTFEDVAKVAMDKKIRKQFGESSAIPPHIVVLRERLNTSPTMGEIVDVIAEIGAALEIIKMQTKKAAAKASPKSKRSQYDGSPS